MNTQSVVLYRNHDLCSTHQPPFADAQGRQPPQKWGLLNGLRTFLIVLLPWLIRYVYWRLTRD